MIDKYSGIVVFGVVKGLQAGGALMPKEPRPEIGPYSDPSGCGSVCQGGTARKMLGARNRLEGPRN